MSEDKVEPAVEKRDDDHVDIDIERIETVSSTTAPWTVRLALGLIGVVLIASAIAGWWFRDFFDGKIATYLPYIIIGLAVLGVLGIVESITKEIWMTLIIGVVALAVTFLIVGRSQLVPNEGALYVVDRFTGSVQFCTPDGCLPLKQVAELPKPPVPLVLPAEPMAAPPEAVPAPAVPAAPAKPAPVKK
jgi:hypothetical protein